MKSFIIISGIKFKRERKTHSKKTTSEEGTKEKGDEG